jgi:hypothetical protein
MIIKRERGLLTFPSLPIYQPIPGEFFEQNRDISVYVYILARYYPSSNTDVIQGAICSHLASIL